MFDSFPPIRGSLWKQRVNTILGTLFLSTFALWAATVMFQAVWGIDPITQTFAAVIVNETQVR